MDAPFLFIGHGFGSSARTLQGYLWFRRAPGASARARIQRWLPGPVARFCEFDGELMTFGSDDDLEAAVRGKDDGQEPTRADWRAFCAAFETSVRRIHGRNQLVAVLKPDDGAYGRTPSGWHRRSVRACAELAELALARGHHGGLWADFALNLLEDVMPDAKATGRLPASAREPWLRWLDRLLVTRQPERRDRLALRARWLLDAMADGKRELLSAELRRVPRAAEKVEAEPTRKPTRSERRSTTGAGGSSLRQVLDQVLFAGLRADGFQGSRTRLRRLVGGRAHVLWMIDDDPESDPHGRINLGLTSLPARKGASLAEDHGRAISVRNRRSKHLTELVTREQLPWLWYADAEAHWGPAWREELAAFVLQVVRTKGERFLQGKRR